MPVDLIAAPPRVERRNKPALLLAAQLIAVVIIAGASIALESTADDSLAGSARQDIAGP